MNPRRLLKLFLVILSVSVLLGYMIPQHFIMPVAGAGKNSYNKSSFWFYPWGKSVTHKGVDIFAPEGTGVISSTAGIVLFSGVLERGGNAVLVLGPKWRLHYYAHLKEIKISAGRVVYSGKLLGTVGTTGNAKGKPAHLHYSISSLLPIPWRADDSKQGWKKIFYLDPAQYLEQANERFHSK